jgi:hypothetical protein
MRTWTKALLLGAALSLMAGQGLAQPAPTPEEVQQAQSRWTEGKAFFDAGNFEAARVAFKQAHTIFPHPAFLQNLGEAELRTGRYVDASRHLSAFLRSNATSSVTQREGAKKSLLKASEKLGSILVETNVVDAEVRVDDELVGRSPLGSLAWYVEPGTHAVSARKEGYLSGTENVVVAAGPAKSVYVRLQRFVGATVDVTPVSPSTGDSQPLADTTVIAPAKSPAPDGASVAPRTVVLISGIGVTVAALAFGTVYALKAGSDSSLLKSGVAQLPSDSACLKPLQGDVALCNWVASRNSKIQTERSLRDVSFVAAAGVGVATGVAFLLWRPADSKVAVAPLLAPGSAGLQVSSEF